MFNFCGCKNVTEWSNQQPCKHSKMSYLQNVHHHTFSVSCHRSKAAHFLVAPEVWLLQITALFNHLGFVHNEQLRFQRLARGHFNMQQGLGIKWLPGQMAHYSLCWHMDLWIASGLIPVLWRLLCSWGLLHLRGSAEVSVFFFQHPMHCEQMTPRSSHWELRIVWTINHTGQTWVTRNTCLQHVPALLVWLISCRRFQFCCLR